MGFFKKFAQKAKELNEKLNSEEGRLVNKVKELQETVNGEGIDAMTKLMAAGKFISNLGIKKNSIADCSENIKARDEESVDFSEIAGVSDDYKKRFEEEHGISYDDYMAEVIGNAGKPLDEETQEFFRNFGNEDSDEEPLDFSGIAGVSDDYKKRFEEEHGISYDDYMAEVIGNAGKPLD